MYDTLGSHDTNASASSVIWPKQKGYAAYNFNNSDIRSAIVPLMMPSVSHSANASAIN